MNRVLIVTKNGDLLGHNYGLNTKNDLYKVAGLKSGKSFACCAKWMVHNKKNKLYTYCVYGKTDGKANTENKYEFPPPIDNLLLFYNCVIVKMKGDKIVDLDLDEWLYVYDKLYGGFEDLCSEDESEDEEDVKRLKSGYADDGFVVDDCEEDDFYESDEEEILESDDEDELENGFRRGYHTRSKGATVFASLEN